MSIRLWGLQQSFRLRSHRVLISYIAHSNGQNFHKKMTFSGQDGKFLWFQARRSSAPRFTTSDLTVLLMDEKRSKKKKKRNITSIRHLTWKVRFCMGRFTDARVQSALLANPSSLVFHRDTVWPFSSNNTRLSWSSGSVVVVVALYPKRHTTQACRRAVDWSVEGCIEEGATHQWPAGSNVWSCKQGADNDGTKRL